MNNKKTTPSPQEGEKKDQKEKENKRENKQN